MAWMALCVPLNEVRERHVWLLSDTMEMPNGQIVLNHRRRAPRRTPTDVEMNEHIEQREIYGA